MIGEINEQVFWIINSSGNLALDIPMIFFTITGFVPTAFLIGVAAMRHYGGLDRKRVLLLAAAILAGGILVQAIKQTYTAPRPLKHFRINAPPQGYEVRAPLQKLGSRTFPSGHSQTAFAVAVFMILIFRRHAALWLAWAALVALSRVYLGVHFPLDIIVGAIIGGAFSGAVVYAGYKTLSPDSTQGR